MHAGRIRLRRLETKLHLGIDANPCSGSESQHAAFVIRVSVQFNEIEAWHPPIRFVLGMHYQSQAEICKAGRLIIGLKIGRMS